MSEVRGPKAGTSNISFDSIADLSLVVLCHARNNPTDLEWMSYLELLQSIEVVRSEYSILVHSDGGHPTRSQQMAMSEIAKNSQVRVAIVSPSIAARFITSVLVLSNPAVRCFSPQQRLEAYAHLGLPTTAAGRIDDLCALLLGKVRN
ncbi:MAG TPA: hypothetical protein VIV60_27375 [Polyangiaceae bacterium]